MTCPRVLRSGCTAALLLLCLVLSPARGDELLLKNGLRLKGTVLPISGLNAPTIAQNNNTEVPVAMFWMCDDGVRRFFVPRRFAEEMLAEDMSRTVTFQLTHQRSGSKGIPVTIGRFEKTDFDRYGRRTITLRTVRGPEPVQQAITQIRPEYLKVESTSHSWTIGLDLSAIPLETLRQVISQDSDFDPKRPEDRKAVVAFFVQAGMYQQAREELETMAGEFPELAGWAEETRREVAHLTALQALQEIRRRQEAGQHQFAAEYAAVFPPERVSADVLREAREIAASYARLRQQADAARMQLDLLQAEIDPQQAQRLAPLRAALLTELHPETVPRLEPFLRAETDDSLSPAEKLALAYSAWVLGSADALTRLEETIRLWDARFLLLEYLRAGDNPTRRQMLLDELIRTEGVSLPRVVQMIPRLPPPLASGPAEPGLVQTFDVEDAWQQVRHRYSVVLPPEYSPQHAYPLLVVLHAAGMSPEQALAVWAGDQERLGPAQRFGYVTIAPHYADPQDRSHSYDARSHAAVLDSIHDARRRFRIDSDRVYLTGHGMGGDACFDVAMSHPGVFAGAIPINGVSDRYCMYYRGNAPDLAWYVVGGERDGDERGLNLDRNARDLNFMMTRGHNVLYCEYKARGFEMYAEELPRIFQWMAAQRRAPLPRDWDVNILRPSDTSFHWLRVSGLPPRLSEPILWDATPRRAPRPLTIRGKITLANTIHLEHPGQHSTVWLSPQFVDFDQRIRIHHKGRQSFYDFVTPSLGDLLEDLRVRGDRERLYWAKVEL